MRNNLLITVLTSVFLVTTVVKVNAQVSDKLIYYPDTIYINAVVVTLDEHAMNDDPGTIAEALAVRGESIQAIGSTEELIQMRGPDTEVIDLGGKMMIPGFIESHTHPFGTFEQYLPE
ncbi:MAG: amidohydrolase family protein, partial [Gammaproteobacteria bacterium]|nr:amidohydrolase family protein [Gammaproteobacteria bacterium]NIO63683.1 amidohydrolase family protein [Gammaproteobacteria bacterium]